MRTKDGILIAFVTALVVLVLLGVGFTIGSYSKSEKTGTFTAEDMKEYSDYTHKIGSEEMRDVIKALNTDTSARACQKVKLPK